MASDRVIARAVETSIGTRMPRTSFGALKDCVVVLPPLAEQRRIVDLMGSFDAAIMRAHELRRAAVECRSALLANLLSGKDTIAESYDELIGV